MNLTQFIHFADQHYNLNRTHLRMGQAYFNALFMLRPNIAKEISGTDYDPFYQDDKLPVFLTKVEELLTADC
jgi:hypothetical protein